MSVDRRKRKLYGLRYRMKKKGYRFNGRHGYCYMPDDPQKRSKLMEQRLIAFGYGIECSLLHLFAENGGGGKKSLLLGYILLVTLLIVTTNL